MPISAPKSIQSLIAGFIASLNKIASTIVPFLISISKKLLKGLN